KGDGHREASVRTAAVRPKARGQIPCFLASGTARALHETQQLAHSSGDMSRHLPLAVVHLARAPVDIADLDMRLAHLGPLDVAISNFTEAFFNTPPLDVQLHDAASQGADPLLAGCELPGIADVEVHADPGTLDFVDVVPQLVRRLTEPVPHVLDQ